jgi:hypothetical protein
MPNTDDARAGIHLALTQTISLITAINTTLSLLEGRALLATPVGQHLTRARTELLRARMQAGAFLDIG